MLQGFTEFLPVSSSGHLVIMQHFFGLTDENLFFDTMVHVGTLLPVLWVFRQELVCIARRSLAVTSSFFSKGSAPGLLEADPDVRMVMFIVLASLPTGLIGLLGRDVFARLFSSVGAVGVGLLITATLLLSTKWYAHPRKSLAEMTAFDAMVIGFVQGLAITPGISRSGTTIATALLRGVDRELAGRFSFLIFIPAMCGALVLNVVKLSAFPSFHSLCLAASATVTACLTGYLMLLVLLRFVRQGKLYVFSPYCFLIGIGALALAWMG